MNRSLLAVALVGCALLAYAAGVAVGLHAGERRGHIEMMAQCQEVMGNG